MTLAQVATKLCPACDTHKPLEDFYQQGERIHPNCRKCENAKPRTRSAKRAANQRARQRATAKLIRRHLPEFEALKALCLVEVEREMAELAEAAPEHLDDQQVVPLKPGQRMEGETVVDRIDVARCTDCHRHHDRGHECPMCGSVPGEDYQWTD